MQAKSQEKCPNNKECLPQKQVSEAAWGWLSTELWTIDQTSSINALDRCD